MAIRLHTRIRYAVSIASLVLFAAAAAASQAPTQATSSIEGIVVKRGTNEPIANVDLELSRVEGTDAAPLGRGVAEAFAAILYSTAQGLPATGATPPAILAPEVKYTKTGADGRFTFKDLKEGKYRLVAVQGGGTYYPVEFGQHDLRQRGLNFPIASGQTKKDVKLEMTLTGAISGRVVDEEGQPMGHAVVMALTVQYSGGEPRSYIERIAVTDERGDYRIYWLEPARYYVAAINEDQQRRTINTAPTAPPGRTVERYRATSPVVTHQNLPDGSAIEESYGVVYFAGTTDLRARTSVEVRAGETSSGVDIPMGVGKAQTHHIRGVVINGETGQPAPSADLFAIPREWSPNALVLSGTSNAKGEFDLRGARPEGYIVSAEVSATVTTTGLVTGPVPAGAQVIGGYTRSVGYVPVDMGNADVNNMQIVTVAGINVPGHVVIEGKSPGEAGAELPKMNVGLTRNPDLIAMPSALMQLPAPPAVTPPPAVFPPRNGEVASSGDFTLFMSPGDFRMNVDGISSNAYVKSIRMGGEDVLRSGMHVTRAAENPVEITIATDGGTISGTVVDDITGPFSNATVALVPDSLDQRGRPDLYRKAASDFAGNFQMTAIPPGSYKLFAWEWAEPDSWQNADFIRAYESRGKPVTISGSAKQDKIQLNVITNSKAAR